jgi:hypothetical protein
MGNLTSSATTADFDNGDGSDGALVFDGVTKVIELTPSANEYTLTRDVFATTIVVNKGVTIKTAGFRIRASVSVSGEGTIADNGKAGAEAVAGAALSEAGTLARTSTAGGAGEVTTAKAGSNATKTLGGAGGKGGEGKSGNTGGAAGTATALEAKLGSVHEIGLGLFGYLSSAAGIQKPVGGAGGGGGTGDGTRKGGGGGSGGGIVFISTPKIYGTLKIEAVGGAGGIGETGGEAGGGGGGGGGAIILACAESVNTSVTTNVAGGAAGKGTGATKEAAAGEAGTVFTLGPTL